MRRLLSIVALTATFAADSSSGEELPSSLTVQGVLQNCKAAMAGFEGNDMTGDGYMCYGMMMGLAFALVTNCVSHEFGYNPSPRTSMSELPTYAAGIQAFINWAEANPQKWDELGAAGFVEALTQAFPCQN